MNDLISSGSYLAIFVIIMLTGAGLPMPEEVPIVAAGVLSSPRLGELNPWLAFIACLSGAIAGDSVMYWIGRRLGNSGLRKHPLLAWALTRRRSQQVEQVIGDHGIKVFLIARFLVGVRGPMYLAAGMAGVRYRTFLARDGICATLVVGLVFWLSYYCGAWIGPLIRESQVAATVLVVVLAIGAGIYYAVWRRYRTRLVKSDLTNDSGASAIAFADTHAAKRVPVESESDA